jgi:hypothetical protein
VHDLLPASLTDFLRVLAAPGVTPVSASALTRKTHIQMKTILRFGLATLTVGAFLGGAVLSNAETPDIFTKHGLPVPGVYFKNQESQQPATVAVSKAGQGVGDQKTFKAAKKQTRHVHSPTRAGS